MIKLFVCGDISNISGNIDFIGPNIKRVIQDSDYSIANLEGVELDKTESLIGKPFQSEGTCNYLKEVGFNLLLLANNHITDGGKEKLEKTIKTIERCGIDHIGAGKTWEDANAPMFKEIKGHKLAFVNVCEAQPGYFRSPNQQYGFAWTGNEYLFHEIDKLKNTAEYVIVFVHAGLEHYPLPLSEIRAFYRKLCDAGASCVIGGHPHCAQGYEYYNKSFIAYSLGNFFFPRPNSAWKDENTSYSLLLNLSKDGGITAEVVHHYMDGSQVEILKEKANQIDVERLCRNLEEGYEAAADAMCMEAYNKVCRGILVDSLCGEYENISFLESIKNLLRRSLFRRRYIIETSAKRQLQLLRLFENETYRYVITRALQITTRNE